MENQGTQHSGAAPQDATSYSQDSATGSASSQGKGGILGNIQMPESVKNIQMPQSVKDFGSTVGRSYNSMSTTQKVLGGAAILGATYWVANNQGWLGQAKNLSGSMGKKSKNSKNQQSAEMNDANMGHS